MSLSIDRRALIAALAALPASAKAAGGDIIIPLHYNAGILWTLVQINDFKPSRFIVHTGQTFFNISEKLATEMALPQKAAAMEKALTPHGEVELKLFVGADVIIGSALRLQNVAFVGRDYRIGSSFGGTVPYLTSTPLTFDFENDRLIVHQTSFTPPEGATRLRLTRPSGFVSTVPVVNAELDGQPLKLALNTGGYDGVTLHPATVARLNLWDRYGPGLTNSGDGSPGDRLTRLVRAGKLSLGGFDFPGPVVELNAPHEGAAPMFSSDGSIGLQVLRRFNIAFRPMHFEVWLQPIAARMGEPFNYSRSGYSTRRMEDGGTVVSDVRRGGPAEKAGLRVGDRFAPATLEQQLVRAFKSHGAVGTSYPLTVIRDGQPVTVTIVLEDLI